MEEKLFILKKKFVNSRITRNIYMYMIGDRSYWLSKYRFCIKNGYNKNLMVCGNCGNRMYYSKVSLCTINKCNVDEILECGEVCKVIILQKGVFRAQLNSTYYQINAADIPVDYLCEIGAISENNRMAFFKNP